MAGEMDSSELESAKRFVFRHYKKHGCTITEVGPTPGMKSSVTFWVKRPAVWRSLHFLHVCSDAKPPNLNRWTNKHFRSLLEGRQWKWVVADWVWTDDTGAVTAHKFKVVLRRLK